MHVPKRPALLCSLALAFASGRLAAQPTVGFPEYPSISPDGSLIVYMWGGDLWAVPAEGGISTRLTSHPADERASAFSPDGTTLAFESDRDGARNLYTMSLMRQGSQVLAGEVRRITRTDRSQSLSGFSHDGKELLFTGSLEPSIYRHERMYRAPLDGGPVTRISDAYGGEPRMNADGSMLVFTRGRCEWERPAYQGSGERQVWTHTFADGGFKEITTWNGNDGDGFFLPDNSIIFISSRDGQNNLYRLAPGASDPGTPNGPGITQLTSFKPTDGELTIGHGVRDLVVARGGSAAVFCVWDRIYTLDLTQAGASPKAVTLLAAPDAQRPATEQITLDRQISEAALSPDGKAIAVIARGEVFVRSTESDRPTRRVTNTYGRERDLVWSPDGRSLYFSSDEGGTLGIYEARVSLALEDIMPETEKAEANGASTTKPAEVPKPAAGAQAVVGVWSCKATGGPPLPPAGLPFTLTIESDGAGLRGTMSAPPMYDGPVSGIAFDAASGKLSFSINVPNGTAMFALTVAGKSLSGAVTVAETSFNIAGQRDAAERVAPADTNESWPSDEVPAQPATPQPTPPPPPTPPTAPVATAASDRVSGSWHCRAKGPAPLPEDGVDVVLELTLEGTAVTGKMVAPGWIEGEITGGAWDGTIGRLTGSIATPAGPGTLTLDINNDACTGTLAVAEAMYHLTGERRPEPAPVPGAGPDATEPEKPQEKPEEKKPKIDHGKRWAESLRFEVRPLIDTEVQEHSPLPSPDGRHMLYIRDRGDLVLVSMKDGSERVVFTGWDEPGVQWAGDSRHIVYDVADLDFNTDIWLLDVLDPEAEPQNLTRHPDLDSSPRMSADGKVLAFISDRAGNNFEFNVYAVYLDKSLEGLTSYQLADHFKKAADEAKKAKPIDPIDWDAEYTPPEPLKFEVDDAHLRVRRMTNFPGSQSTVAITPAGDRILFTASIDGSFGFYSVDYKGDDRKSVTTGGVGDVRVSAKGDVVSFVSSGQARSAGTTGGRSENYPISATVVIELDQQQRQKFLEMARILETQFYHPTLKGLNWRGLTERYAQLAMQTAESNAFNRVGRMLMGELDGSHLGIGGGGGGFSAPSERYGYLGVDVVAVPGGYRVERVLPGSPADARSTQLLPGDILISVNGNAFAPGAETLPNVDMVSAMIGTAGEQVLLELRRESKPEMQYMLIVPTSFGAISNLGYEDEVQRRREMVDKLSDGKIGYLHIRGMSQPSVRDFERDLYAAAHGKVGLLIDVRDNGGGSTADILLASLTAPVHAYTVPRGADKAEAAPVSYPRDRRLIHPYQRPISVLINQNSFSNAEIFAHAIKTIGRGKLVGTPTFGGVISTGAASLIDGSSVRTPFRGWYLPDGTDMEENGAVPDINVPQLPQDEAAGRDAQLEAAVKELLERVASTPEGIWKPGR